MTPPNRKRTLTVTTAGLGSPHSSAWDPELRLKEFLDWLVDPREQALRKGKGAGARTLRKSEKVLSSSLKQLQLVRREWISQDLESAIQYLERGLEDLKNQRRQVVYESDHLSMTQDREGNLDKQRRWFAAQLIATRLHHSPRFRDLFPHRDAFANLASYVTVERKLKEDIYASAKQSVYRYLKGQDLAPLQVLELLYAQFLWSTRSQAGYSEEERQMLQDLCKRRQVRGRLGP